MKGGQADGEAGLLCQADCKAVSLGTNTCSSFKIDGRPPGPPGRASRCSGRALAAAPQPPSAGPWARDGGASQQRRVLGAFYPEGTWGAELERGPRGTC